MRTHDGRRAWPRRIALAVALALVPVEARGVAAVMAAVSPAATSAFVPVTPCRLFDTRPAPDTVGSRATPLGPAGVHVQPVVGANGGCSAIPAAATGVALNVTTVGGTAASFLTVYPADADRPLASNLNWVEGAPPTPNKVDVKLSAAGTVAFYNHAGTVDVLADVVGFYVPVPAPTSGFSSANLLTVIGVSQVVLVSAGITVAAGATVVANASVTATSATGDGLACSLTRDAIYDPNIAQGWDSAAADGTQAGTVTSVRHFDGLDAGPVVVSFVCRALDATVFVARPQLSIVQVPAGAAGQAQASAFVPVTPCRLFDTRPAPDTVGPHATPLGPASTHVQAVVGTNGACSAIPAAATGVALNVTAVGGTAASFLTVYPADTDRPLASNLNWVAEAPPTPNKVDVKLSATGTIAVYNHAGTVDVLADVVGYYMATGATAAYVASPGSLAGTTAPAVVATRSIVVPQGGTIVATAALTAVSDTADGAHCSLSLDGTFDAAQSQSWDSDAGGDLQAGTLSTTRRFASLAAGLRTVSLLCRAITSTVAYARPQLSVLAFPAETGPVAAAGFVPISPCRLFDTRPVPDTVGSRAVSLGPSETFTQPVVGSNGRCAAIPPEASGVAMNVTTVDGTASSFLTVYPSDAPRPLASSLNWVTGAAPTPNKVDVKLSASGAISLYNHTGRVDVLADVVGYYLPAPVPATAATSTATSLNGDATPVVVASAAVVVPAGGAIVANGIVTLFSDNNDGGACSLSLDAVYDPTIAQAWQGGAGNADQLGTVRSVRRFAGLAAGTHTVNYVCRALGSEVIYTQRKLTVLQLPG